MNDYIPEDEVRTFELVITVDYGNGWRGWFSELIDQWVVTARIGFMYLPTFLAVLDFVKGKVHE